MCVCLCVCVCVCVRERERGGSVCGLFSNSTDLKIIRKFAIEHNSEPVSFIFRQIYTHKQTETFETFISGCIGCEVKTRS
jgi:hypothetical protein